MPEGKVEGQLLSELWGLVSLFNLPDMGTEASFNYFRALRKDDTLEEIITTEQWAQRYLK